MIQKILQELSWEVKWLIYETEYCGAYCFISDTENFRSIIVGIKWLIYETEYSTSIILGVSFYL